MPGRRQRDEAGAVAVLVGVTMSVVLLVVAAFAVDLGKQRVGRRDMQSLADLVALDLSRLVDGRTTSVIEADPAWATTRIHAVEQNDDFTVGDDLEVTAVLGTLDDAGGFTATGAGDVPTAVEVTASVDVSRAFVPGSGGAVRSAVAANEETACFKLGSYAAAISSGDSALLAPLNGLLGLNLSLLSYQGLAGADISIDDLVATGQVGTTEQLLGSTVSLGTLYAATLAALQEEDSAEGVDNTAAITALNALVAANVNLSQPLTLGEVLNVDPDDGAALATEFNVLDLLTGAALVADGDNAVAVTGLTAGTATVGGITVNTLKVIERPSRACGTVSDAPDTATCATAPTVPRGCARNSQLQGAVTIPLTLANTPVGSTFFKVSTAGAQLALNLGNAVGVLSAPEPTCGDGTLASPDTEHVSLATSLATASLTAGIHLETNALNLGILGSVIVSADVNLATSIPTPAPTGSAALSIPPNQTTPVSGGSDVRLSSITATPTVTLSIRSAGSGLPLLGATLATATGLVNTLFGITTVTATAALTAVISGPVNALIGSLNTLLLGPLATLLGLDVAGADVYAVGRPTCQTPKLVG